jgi:hypothetical protein
MPYVSTCWFSLVKEMHDHRSSYIHVHAQVLNLSAIWQNNAMRLFHLHRPFVLSKVEKVMFSHVSEG